MNIQQSLGRGDGEKGRGAPMSDMLKNICHWTLDICHFRPSEATRPNVRYASEPLAKLPLEKARQTLIKSELGRGGKRTKEAVAHLGPSAPPLFVSTHAARIKEDITINSRFSNGEEERGRARANVSTSFYRRATLPNSLLIKVCLASKRILAPILVNKPVEGISICISKSFSCFVSHYPYFFARQPARKQRSQRQRIKQRITESVNTTSTSRLARGKPTLNDCCAL
jgi:hypothetical protein